MNDDQILEEIKRQGLLDDVTINHLKRDSLISGESIEATIFKQKLVDNEKLAELKSSFIKIPYKKIDAQSIDDKVLALIGENIARTYQTIPLSLDNNIMIVGMVHPEDTKSQDAIKFIARQNHYGLGVYLISYGDWQDVLRRYSPYTSDIEQAVQSLNISEGKNNDTVDLGASQGESENAPIIKIVADTLREAVEKRASDIHIEPQEKNLRIRFRIDGNLVQIASLPVELSQSVVSRVKVMSNLKIDETRVPQDGRFRAKIFNKDIDFRIATFPTPRGEKVAIRVLDPTTGLKSFENLQFLYKNLEIVKAGLSKPYGMILITGPTGSGKSTTLYAFLQTLNNDKVNIVSLEDPVEYFVSGINQSQVHPEIGYDFASGLREILRQDPDIVMVGEIRDEETAGLAVQAALTGHVVLSTLHTNNAAGVIPRLIDMKVEPFLLPVSLNLMISQRLIGMLCNSCKYKEQASPDMQDIIRKTLSVLPDEIKNKYKEPYEVYHAKGCPICNGKGVLGREAIFEAFRMTPELEDIISSGPTVQKVINEAKRQGMLTLRQDGVIKALEGIVSVEEVIRITDEE